MTPSDWIDLGPLAVALASMVFIFLTNSQNIRAKRADLITEKSVDAFVEFVAKMIDITDLYGELGRYYVNPKNRLGSKH